MNLSLSHENLDRYKSSSQRARVATESWAEGNLFCCVCDCVRLVRLRHNTPGFDLSCPRCNSRYQLKSQSKKLGSTILGSAYSEMKKAILGDRNPNLILLHYDPQSWRVQNVVVIPSFAFVMSVIESRKPLAPTARRAGWIGCKILLGKVPADSRIAIVNDGKVMPPARIREAYNRLQPIRAMKPEQRGWVLDVLRVVRSLKRTEFLLSDVYRSENELSALHPNNGHIREKIRQQLQVLRDTGFLKFLCGGKYRVVENR
jgi:type II restriction enzyme